MAKDAHNTVDGIAAPPPDIRRPQPNATLLKTFDDFVPSNTRASSSDDGASMSRDRPSSYTSHNTEDLLPPSLCSLPALQVRGPPAGFDQLEPLLEDDPASYDLLQPNTVSKTDGFSLETRVDQLLSKQHLHKIFADPARLLKFTSFLSLKRPESIPILIYYLDALKALRAIRYANAIAAALEPLSGHAFTNQAVPSSQNKILETRADQAFNVLVRDDLPAYITEVFTRVASISIQKRITGTLAPHLREASEGLAEVFCLTDVSRPDNPIVFASEEFHRTTQYGVDYAIGRNCRFLQGPKTNPASVKRFSEAVKLGKDHSEIFLNYRRDGSPFMNLLMISGLKDNRGVLRYFLGAQVDVSGLVKDCAGLEGLQKMLEDQESGAIERDGVDSKDELWELAEMFNGAELETVRKHGGGMHQEQTEDGNEGASIFHRPRLMLHDHSYEPVRPERSTSDTSGRLSGVYSHFLLVRPYPSLRILFTSPSLRIPGILQSQLMKRVGSSPRVREELMAALAEGRGVTAKIRWLHTSGEEGRTRWMHCTPLLDYKGNVGVWMVVLVNDDSSQLVNRFKQPPPVAAQVDMPGISPARSRGGTPSLRSVNGSEIARNKFEQSPNGSVGDFTFTI